MSDAGLLVIVPSRGRPESVPRMIEAWQETDAYATARLVYVIDADDPRCGAYFDHDLPDAGRSLIEFVTIPRWEPLVPKLNRSAAAAVTMAAAERPWAGLAFMGDDHLPRTKHWAATVATALAEMRTGIVYGRDGYQDEKLPTWWAMTPDVVCALGGMVPATVEHLFCDNAVKELGQAADCLRYLPEVLIEHMHPIAGKGQMDAGYQRANSPYRYKRDEERFRLWRERKLPAQAAAVRALREARA